MENIDTLDQKFLYALLNLIQRQSNAFKKELLNSLRNKGTLKRLIALGKNAQRGHENERKFQIFQNGLQFLLKHYDDKCFCDKFLGCLHPQMSTSLSNGSAMINFYFEPIRFTPYVEFMTGKVFGAEFNELATADVVEFQNTQYVGKGTYGTVYRAFDPQNSRNVALKLMHLLDQDHPDQLCPAVDRELTNLKHLRHGHANVVKLLNICVGEAHSNLKTDLLMVFELCAQDLTAYLKSFWLNPAQIKDLMKGILKGAAFIHSKGLVHGDLKPDNILMTHDAIPKIADFGISKIMQPGFLLTTLVQSRWFRAPEVIFGCSYDLSIDVWSIGCIFAQLYTGSALLPGNGDGDQTGGQLELTVRLCREQLLTGLWPEKNKFSLSYDALRSERQWLTRSDADETIARKLRRMKDDGPALSLFQMMMQFFPSNRITFYSALQHPYFDFDEEENHFLPFPPNDNDLSLPLSIFDNNQERENRWSERSGAGLDEHN